MAIEDNIRNRKTAEDVIDLGVSLAKDAGIPADQIRDFWCRVREVIGDLINEHDPIAPLPVDVAETRLRTFRAFDDDDLFPFGRPREEGLTMSEVPEDYRDWFMRQQWRDEWPAVVEYFESAE